MEARLRSYKKSPSKQSELPARIALALLLPVGPLLLRGEPPFRSFAIRIPSKKKKKQKGKRGRRYAPSTGRISSMHFYTTGRKTAGFPPRKGHYCRNSPVSRSTKSSSLICASKAEPYSPAIVWLSSLKGMLESFPDFVFRTRPLPIMNASTRRCAATSSEFK